MRARDGDLGHGEDHGRGRRVGHRGLLVRRDAGLPVAGVVVAAERGNEPREQRGRRREVAAAADRVVAAREQLDRRRQAVRVDVPGEAVAADRGSAEREVRLPGARDVVVADDVVAGQPEVVVEVRQDRDAVDGAVQDHVALDDVLATAADQDPGTERRGLETLRRDDVEPVLVDRVAGDGRAALGREALRVEGVRDDPGAVVGPLAVDDPEVAAGVGARVARARCPRPARR